MFKLLKILYKPARLTKSCKDYFETRFVFFSFHDCPQTPPAVVIGVYNSGKSGCFRTNFNFTPTGERLNKKTKGKLSDYLKFASPPPEVGEVRILFGIDDNFPQVAVVGLGEERLGYNPIEQMHEKKEAIRIAAATGVRALQEIAVKKIFVESFDHAESAAEGAIMGKWTYQEMKMQQKQVRMPSLHLFDSIDTTGWNIGREKGRAQNTARNLAETPTNLSTPSLFAQKVVDMLIKVGVNVEIKIKQWAQLRNMNAFLAVGQGSCNPPVLLELLYEGNDPTVNPIVLVGSGITFDTGGLCQKKPHLLLCECGEIVSAACVVATFTAVGSLRLPINLKGIIPLAVNVAGASAYKPGDVIQTMSGKTVYVEDTDNSEGLLLAADALTYAAEFNPKLIVNVAATGPGMFKALGTAASAVFSNSESLYETMRIASIHTGDRIWKLPLWNYFSEYVGLPISGDLGNLTLKAGGPGKAAAFISEFIPKGIDWIHLDTYNIKRTAGVDYAYLREGVSGRPTRTLIEFLAQLCCQIPVEETKKL